MFMENGDNMLRDKERREFELEGGGCLSLEYRCEANKLPAPDAITSGSEEKRSELASSLGTSVLSDLEDFARKKVLRKFVEVHLIEDMVYWERVCADKATPTERAMAVFAIYNQQGESGLRRLQAKIREYEKCSRVPDYRI